MKRIFSLMLVFASLLCFLFSCASYINGKQGENGDQGEAAAETSLANNAELGKYSIVIDSCRLAKGYDKKDVAIIKLIFTNVSDEDPAMFASEFDVQAYQKGIGMVESYVFDEEFSGYENRYKKVKKGSSIEVELVYELNDLTNDIEIEVKELFGFTDKTITKTFTIS